MCVCVPVTYLLLNLTFSVSLKKPNRDRFWVKFCKIEFEFYEDFQAEFMSSLLACFNVISHPLHHCFDKLLLMLDLVIPFLQQPSVDT